MEIFLIIFVLITHVLGIIFSRKTGWEMGRLDAKVDQLEMLKEIMRRPDIANLSQLDIVKIILDTL